MDWRTNVHYSLQETQRQLEEQMGIGGDRYGMLQGWNTNSETSWLEDGNR